MINERITYHKTLPLPYLLTRLDSQHPHVPEGKKTPVNVGSRFLWQSNTFYTQLRNMNLPLKLVPIIHDDYFLIRKLKMLPQKLQLTKIIYDIEKLVTVFFHCILGEYYIVMIKNYMRRRSRLCKSLPLPCRCLAGEGTERLVEARDRSLPASC